MGLFDWMVRTDGDVKDESEGEFGYLNRSARPEFARMRRAIGRWFRRYPRVGKAEMRARLRSDEQFSSAFFELLLHETLVRLGCRVVLHPRVGEETDRRPDFLVNGPAGCGDFYLEATLATGQSEEDRNAAARDAALTDALNRVKSPDFLVAQHVRHAGTGSAPARRIRGFLQSRLSQLAWEDEWRKAQEAQGGSGGVWLFQDAGWEIEFRPFPKPPHLRGRRGVKPLAVRHFGPAVITTHEAIRGAVNRKAGRYGDLAVAYVVAVNSLSDDADEDDAYSALLGDPVIYVRRTTDGVKEAEGRESNGSFWGPEGPRNTRVSAVLVATRARPWLGRVSLRLFHNPWAARPYECALTRLPQAIPEEGRMVERDGIGVHEALGLPAEWPSVAASRADALTEAVLCLPARALRAAARALEWLSARAVRSPKRTIRR